MSIILWDVKESAQLSQRVACSSRCCGLSSVVYHGWEGKMVVEGVVSKETVVLRRWGSSIQKFGFINGVDNVNWPPYRDSKS